MFEPDDRNRIEYNEHPTWRQSLRNWWADLGRWTRIYVLALGLIVAVVVGAAVASREPSEPPQAPTNVSPGDRYLDEYGGNAAVYARIAAMTDCDALQAQFDVASANNDRAEAGTDAFTWTLGYMRAADDRMESLGCYD